MAFCINCGKELDESAKYCANCGKVVENIISSTERKTIYDGEIHKCPNCGEVLGAFVSVCPSCGYELRGTQSASAIKNFSFKIEQATSDEQKVVLY